MEIFLQRINYYIDSFWIIGLVCPDIHPIIRFVVNRCSIFSYSTADDDRFHKEFSECQSVKIVVPGALNSHATELRVTIQFYNSTRNGKRRGWEERGGWDAGVCAGGLLLMVGARCWFGYPFFTLFRWKLTWSPLNGVG